MSKIVRLLLEKGHSDIVKLLKEAGGQEFQIPCMTDLRLAAVEDNTNKVKSLLEEGANINEKAKNGRTILSFVATTGQTDVLEMLLEKGADVNATDNVGFTALKFASVKKNTEIIQLLKNAGGRE